jgi:Mrp family chromosome partitioning ATPase
MSEETKGQTMKNLIRPCALAAALLLGAGAANAGPATVTFDHPENFADLPRDTSSREQVLADLSDHFGALAAKLPAGQEMKVEVLDLDLAGRNWPGIWGTRELRVVEGGADWPHIKFRYTISQEGKVIRSGEETVQNMDYMWRLNRYSTGDSLRYEKQMLDSWFKTLTAAR